MAKAKPKKKAAPAHVNAPVGDTAGFTPVGGNAPATMVDDNAIERIAAERKAAREAAAKERERLRQERLAAARKRQEEAVAARRKRMQEIADKKAADDAKAQQILDEGGKKTPAEKKDEAKTEKILHRTSTEKAATERQTVRDILGPRAQGADEARATRLLRRGETVAQIRDEMRTQRILREANAPEQPAAEAPTSKATSKYGKAAGRTAQEQKAFEAQQQGAISSASPNFVPQLDDFLLDQFGLTPDDAAALTANRFGYTRFRDPRGNYTNPVTGKPYTAEDYNAGRDRGDNWTVNPEDMQGPIFRKHGTAPGQPLSLADQKALAGGAADTSGLPEGSFGGADSDQAQTMLDWIREQAGWARNDPKTLEMYQRKLYRAGYFDDVGDTEYHDPLDPESGKFVKEPQYGTLDPATIQASKAFSGDAAALGFALNKDVWELLDYFGGARDKQIADARANAPGDGGGGGGGGGGGAASPVPVTDEQTIRQLGDTIGQEVFGRRLSGEESQLVTDLIRNLEIREGAQREAGGVVETIDPEAEIRKALRDKAPKEAQAHDISGAFSMFVNSLQAGMGLGQGFGSSEQKPTGGAGGVFASPSFGGGAGG